MRFFIITKPEHLFLAVVVLLLSCAKHDPEFSITSMLPTTGSKGTVVNIVGQGFSSKISDIGVSLNGKNCEINNATTTQLTVTIPPAAGSGNLQIKVVNRTIESTPFEYIYTITVSTLAGSTLGFADGIGTDARFSGPESVAVDAADNVYVTDRGNFKVRKISPTGVVTTLAGTTQGFTNGAGDIAQFSFLGGIAVDALNNVYVGDQNSNKIRKITPSGFVSTFAGVAKGSNDGAIDLAQFYAPDGVAIDASGNVYVADRGNQVIRKISVSGVVTTLAGSTQGFMDGTGIATQFDAPSRIAVDVLGNLYVSDLQNNRIRKITPLGIVSTLAGSSQGFADGTGTAAQFYYPSGVAVDGSGNVYVSDRLNYKIRKINSDGVVTTIAGSTSGFADDIGANAKFTFVGGMAIGSNGNLYVADVLNNKIRKLVID